jgi:GT2 family glycosyltransferase
LSPCDAVTVNYNSGPAIVDCVRSLAGDVGRCIVVDNGSTDGSLAALEALNLANLVIIRNGANLGFSRACNIGLAAAAADAVLFINPDGRLEPGALMQMLGVLDSAPDVGMVGPLLLGLDGLEQRGGRRALPTLASGFSAGFGLARLARFLPGRFGDFNRNAAPLPAGPVAVEAISGGCMLTRRAALRALGGWDEDYFLHVEDLDLCFRFGKAGYRIMFVPGARAVHAKGGSSAAIPFFVERHKHRGMIRYYHKFFADGHPAPLIWLVSAGVWLRFALVVARHALKSAVASSTKPKNFHVE